MRHIVECSLPPLLGAVEDDDSQVRNPGSSLSLSVCLSVCVLFYPFWYNYLVGQLKVINQQWVASTASAPGPHGAKGGGEGGGIRVMSCEEQCEAQT